MACHFCSEEVIGNYIPKGGYESFGVCETHAEMVEEQGHAVTRFAKPKKTRKFGSNMSYASDKNHWKHSV